MPLITHVRHVTRSNYTGGRAHARNSLLSTRGGGGKVPNVGKCVLGAHSVFYFIYLFMYLPPVDFNVRMND